MPLTRDAAGLRAALAALPVRVDAATCVSAPAQVPSYPGGRRPHSVVRLAGGGAEGHGEHVGWTEAEHAAFRAALVHLPAGRTTVGAWVRAASRRITTPYDRAALEAAVIDLALRQHGTNLFGVAGRAPAPVRYVVSFARGAAPAAEAARHPRVELKIDVDPTWPDATWAALAALGRVAVLDWKGAGDAVAHERAHRALPAALHEDPGAGAGPWPASLRVSADAAILVPEDVDRLPLPPAAVNVKPARMGGVLAALDTVARCAARGIAVYLGGMFEVGVGRRQLRDLAALFAPGGPNDVAPIARAGAPAPRPARLEAPASAPGFGASA